MLLYVLGLGNIGGQYEGTRHNVGLDVVGRVASELKAAPQQSTYEYEWAVKQDSDRRLVLAAPKLLMNRSGIAARALLQRFEPDPTLMLVVVDDFNLPLGKLRFRRSGSDGGHNGLQSIIETLATENFPRLRLGIGPLPDNMDKADFVLSRFHSEELETKKKMIAIAAEAVIFALQHRFDEAMTKYNIDPA